MHITDKALLVNPVIGSWSGQRADSKISNSVEMAHGAKAGSGVYRKRLIDPDIPELKRIRSKDIEIRSYHHRMTLAWNDDGSRVLATKAYSEYMDKMAELKRDRESYVAEFIRDYPSHKAAAQRSLNGLYVEADYPSQQELADKFYIRMKVAPMPRSEDLRVDLGADEVASLKKQIEEQHTSAMSDLTLQVVGRMKESIDEMLDKLSAYKIEGNKVMHPFRDTIMDGIKDIISLVPKLNITGDVRIDGIASAINNTLLGYTPQDLRDNVFTRTDVLDKASALSDALAKMGMDVPK